ncbi:hypothetical protein [Asticcacaulis sp.]|uniref:hypothetical protein n=1 Tax=Asticcacaulis sp. TaxID=1872648 RepID=UPI002BABD87D|nr:hypothetical protein [Asticcacaulis sp.]HTM80776.1 hypothetical protein [Asticcacaulis sp.]
MDTLDKFENTVAAAVDDMKPENGTDKETDTFVDDVVDEAVAVSRKTDWRKIAGYAAVAAAGALAGYAYGKSHQKTAKTRVERLRDQLGLGTVDMSRLPSSLRDIDFNRVKKTGHDVGSYAKKATHLSAKKVAELTR